MVVQSMKPVGFQVQWTSPLAHLHTPPLPLMARLHIGRRAFVIAAMTLLIAWSPASALAWRSDKLLRLWAGVPFVSFLTTFTFVNDTVYLVHFSGSVNWCGGTAMSNRFRILKTKKLIRLLCLPCLDSFGFWWTACAASGFVYAVLALTGLPCMYSCFYRSRMRGQYDLEEAPVADCLVHFCCEPCSLCQEYRELKNRGFDMGIGKSKIFIFLNLEFVFWWYILIDAIGLRGFGCEGWEANMDRQQRGMANAPTVIAGMNRWSWEPRTICTGKTRVLPLLLLLTFSFRLSMYCCPFLKSMSIPFHI